MREIWVQPLGWEDPLEKGDAPTPVFWPGEFQDFVVHGVTKSQTRLSNFHFTSLLRGSERWREDAGGGDKGSPHRRPNP